MFIVTSGNPKVAKLVEVYVIAGQDIDRKELSEELGSYAKIVTSRTDKIPEDRIHAALQWLVDSGYTRVIIYGTLARRAMQLHKGWSKATGCLSQLLPGFRITLSELASEGGRAFVAMSAEVPTPYDLNVPDSLPPARGMAKEDPAHISPSSREWLHGFGVAEETCAPSEPEVGDPVSGVELGKCVEGDGKVVPAEEHHYTHDCDLSTLVDIHLRAFEKNPNLAEDI
jgi:hypothetical protein